MLHRIGRVMVLGAWIGAGVSSLAGGVADAQPAQEPCSPPCAPSGDEGAAAPPPAHRVLFRGTVDLGYSRMDFPQHPLHRGQGVLVGTTFTVGVTFGRLGFAGGTFAFRGAAHMAMQDQRGRDIGQGFSPAGYLGPTIGLVGRRGSADLTVGGGGGGNPGGGGAGFVSSLAADVNLASVGSRGHVALVLRSDVFLLRDPTAEELVVGFTASGGIAFVLW